MTILARLARTIEAAHAGARRVVVPLTAVHGTDVQYWDDPVGRRRFQRIPLQGKWAEIHLASGNVRATVRVRILDLSVGGARLAGGGLADVEAGMRCRITVPLPGGGSLLGVPAGIVWVQHGLQGSTAGLEFREVPANDMRRLVNALTAGDE